MRYKISEISRMLGITPQSIRFYEKYGIIPCDVDGSTGYRYYDLGSLYTLLNGRQYQNCGCTLAETSELLQTTDVKQVRKAYEQKEEELERSVELQSRILRRVRVLKDQLATAEDNVGQMLTVTSPDFAAVLYSFNSRDERIPPKAGKAISHWGRYMPLSGIMLYFDGYDSPEPAARRHSGFIMERQDAEFLGLTKEEGTFLLPSRKCIYTIVSGNAHNSSVGRDFARVVEQLAQKGIRPCAPPFTRGIVSMDRMHTQKYLTEMWIPIE